MNQIDDMQTFVRIVEAGSITKAAEQLNTVKSAISRRLSDLERRLGVSLLTRTTRSQTLTENGKSYYQQSLRIIDDVAELESGIRHDNCALSGRIKIAAPLVFGLSHLGAALRKFNEIHPDIFLNLDFNDRKVDLIEDGFDLAIRIAKLEDSSLIARKLTHVHMVMSASPDYLKAHGTPMIAKDLLKGHIKLHYREVPENWQLLDEKGKSTTIKVPTAITANNADFLCQAAIDGVGLLYTPDSICYKAIRLGQLQPVLADYLVDTEFPVYAIYPQNRHLSQRVRGLVDYLSQYFSEQPYWQL